MAVVTAAPCAAPGPLQREAYEGFCGAPSAPRWRDSGQTMYSWLDLHGATVAKGFEDGAGETLRRIRPIDPMTPIGVAYADARECLWPDDRNRDQSPPGYHTYPHIDRGGRRPSAPSGC